MCLLGNIEDCTDGTLGDPDAPRCSRKSSLAMALFLFYALITTIMLINLLIAIFRLYFSYSKQCLLSNYRTLSWNVTATDQTHMQVRYDIKVDHIVE